MQAQAKNKVRFAVKKHDITDDKLLPESDNLDKSLDKSKNQTTSKPKLQTRKEIKKLGKLVGQSDVKLEVKSETKPEEISESKLDSSKIGYERGQVVFRCLPFTYVIETQFRASVCDFCLKQCQSGETLKGKSCSACKIVSYCNTACQKKAL